MYCIVLGRYLLYKGSPTKEQRIHNKWRTIAANKLISSCIRVINFVCGVANGLCCHIGSTVHVRAPQSQSRYRRVVGTSDAGAAAAPLK